jgi:tetratricopeptide (TPR) repeat protein
MRGWAYHSKRDYEKAIADYTEAIRLDPNNASVYRMRAEAYRAKGESGKAKADLARAEVIELSPK